MRSVRGEQRLQAPTQHTRVRATLPPVVTLALASAEGADAVRVATALAKAARRARWREATAVRRGRLRALLSAVERCLGDRYEGRRRGAHGWEVLATSGTKTVLAAVVSFGEVRREADLAEPLVLKVHRHDIIDWNGLLEFVGRCGGSVRMVEVVAS